MYYKYAIFDFQFEFCYVLILLLYPYYFNIQAKETKSKLVNLFGRVALNLKHSIVFASGGKNSWWMIGEDTKELCIAFFRLISIKGN